MKKGTKIIIFLLVGLIIFFSINYRNKIKAKENQKNIKIQKEFETLYYSLTDILNYIEAYEAYYKENEHDIVSLLRISPKFENILDQSSLRRAVNIKNLAAVDYKEEYGLLSSINTLIAHYEDIFTKSVMSIDQVDFESLEIIKSDFNKWINWIEENYIINENGNYIYKEYTLEEMIRSGLTKEFGIKDL